MKRITKVCFLIFIMVLSLSSCTNPLNDTNLLNDNNDETSPKSDPDLFFAYHFDEPSGTVVTDSSENGWDGTLQGGSRVSGKINQGIAFTIPEAHIDINRNFTDMVYHQYINTFSVDTWIYPSEVDPSKKYVVFGGENNYEFSLVINNEKIVVLWDDREYLRSDSTISPNKWTYIAFTFDGVNMKIYIDGDIDNETSRTFITEGRLGVGYTIGSGYMGVIDEFRCWKKSLDPQFIMSEYENQK